MKITPREKGETRLTFLAWGDFHARSRFARSSIPEEKWGLLVVHLPLWGKTNHSINQMKHNMVKDLNLGRRQTSWLFTRVAEDLN